jgi:hypothetical protein
VSYWANRSKRWKTYKKNYNRRERIWQEIYRKGGCRLYAQVMWELHCPGFPFLSKCDTCINKECI